MLIVTRQKSLSKATPRYNHAMKPQKKIAYTVGEPAGIGPELIIQLAQTHQLDDIVVIGDARVLQARAEKIGLKLPRTCLLYTSPSPRDRG